jgi:hypothetical protein
MRRVGKPPTKINAAQGRKKEKKHAEAQPNENTYGIALKSYLPRA